MALCPRFKVTGWHGNPDSLDGLQPKFRSERDVQARARSDNARGRMLPLRLVQSLRPLLRRRKAFCSFPCAKYQSDLPSAVWAHPA